jgi:hypothetical protein
VRGALVVSAAGWVAAIGVELAACSSGGSGSPSGTAPAPATPSEDTGKVGLQLTLSGGQTVTAVSWTVTGPGDAGTVVQSGTANVGDSSTISFPISGLPPANGYTVTLSATSTDGTATCTGSAPFNVGATATTNVSVVMQCNPKPKEGGSAMVSATTFSCASVDYISANPAETTTGHSVALSSSATATTPSMLTYSWTAAPGSAGSFDTPKAASANFTCTSATPVSVAITLTVSDGTVPEGGAPCNSVLASETINIQCDPG